MQHLNKRNVALLLLCSAIAIKPSAADEFTTTECHCHRGIWGGGPLENHYGHLTMSYFHAASGTTGVLEKPCEKGGCGPSKGAEIMFCGAPNGSSAFPGGAGFCYNRIKAGKHNTEDRVLFPVTDTANPPLVERDADDDEDEDDFSAFFDEEFEKKWAIEDEDGEDGDEQLTTSVPLPSSTASEPTSTVTSTSTTSTSTDTPTAPATVTVTATETETETATETATETPTEPTTEPTTELTTETPTETAPEPTTEPTTPTTTFVTSTKTTSATPTATMPAATWQPLRHEKKTRLGAKSVCADICFQKYGAYQACGPIGLPWDIPNGKCKTRTWRKLPDVGGLPAN